MNPGSLFWGEAPGPTQAHGRGRFGKLRPEVFHLSGESQWSQKFSFCVSGYTLTKEKGIILS